MKHLVKKLLLGLAVVAIATAPLLAESLVKQYSGTNNYVVVLSAGPADVNAVTIYNPTTNPATVVIYDSASTNILTTNGAYTNFTISSVTFTNIYTNYFGVITTNTYTAMTNTANAVGSTVTTNQVKNEIYVPGTSQVTSTLKFPVMNGIYATNGTTNLGTNLVITVDVNRRF